MISRSSRFTRFGYGEDRVKAGVGFRAISALQLVSGACRRSGGTCRIGPAHDSWIAGPTPVGRGHHLQHASRAAIITPIKPISAPPVSLLAASFLFKRKLRACCPQKTSVGATVGSAESAREVRKVCRGRRRLGRVTVCTSARAMAAQCMGLISLLSLAASSWQSEPWRRCAGSRRG